MTGKPKALPGDSQRTVEAGEPVFRQGEKGIDLFVIQSGTVEISRGDGDERVVMATLRQGAFFGEMSVLESMPRDADAVAVTRTELLVISQGGLLIRLRRDPTFAVEMLHQLSGRVRALNQQLEAERAT
ncbi:MAG: Crp/Fnr family transcriptional regulator [Acidimicrobiales bacterium]